MASSFSAYASRFLATDSADTPVSTVEGKWEIGRGNCPVERARRMGYVIRDDVGSE